MNDVLGGITDNSAALRAYERGLTDPSSLERSEKIRFDLIVLQMLRVAESPYLLSDDGYLSEESWESTLSSLLVVLRTEGGQRSWQRRRGNMSISFRNHLDGRLQLGTGTEETRG